MPTFPKYLQQLGLNIKAARTKAGYKQIDVHAWTGLAYRHYQNIEAGRVNVTLETLYRLAKLYKTTIAELVKDEA